MRDAQSPRINLALAYLEYHLWEALAHEEIPNELEVDHTIVVRRGGVGAGPHTDTFALRLSVKKV